jgi:ABC-type branched-subunit amino acid transport system ATPase component/branched-subunit amino acid ABC-type transport system permease component
MTSFIQFFILGLGVGAAYALLSTGIVVIYRGSGVLNFAQGALAMLASYTFYEMLKDSWPLAFAFIASVLITTVLGLLMHFLVMRPLRNASPVVRVIATLGLLIILESAATLRWTNAPQIVQPWLPQTVWHVGGTKILTDRLIMLVVACALTAALWSVFRYTNLGRAINAVAENRRSAASLGWSPDLLAGLSWGVGSALAGAAGIFIAPLLGALTVEGLTLAVITALAAALIGNFTSLTVTLFGALFLGVSESVLPLYVHQTGFPQAIPLLVIVVLLAATGRGLPLRGYVLDRLPRVGNGKLRLGIVLPVLAVTFVVIATSSPSAVDAVINSAVAGLMMLSIIVLTGYCGQLSLAQYAIAGIAALVAGRLVSEASWGVLPAAAVGIVAAVIVGTALAIPALRTRGINLAVVTLSLGSAVQVLVFDNPQYAGGIDGIVIRSPNIFGWSIDPAAHPARYATLTVLALVVAGLAVATMRRGRVGRRLIAVRTNEKAAAALGINVYEVKLFAFTVASALAALAGVFLAYSNYTVVFSAFDPLQSILVVAFIIIGSVGYVSGAPIGAVLVAGGVLSYLANSWFPSATTYIQLIGGVGVILNLIQAPNGLAALTARQIRYVVERLVPRRVHLEPAGIGPDAPQDGVRIPVPPGRLDVRGLTVRFGGVVAVDEVSFSVAPGEIVGLIGPNGAGKTTVIDAITGFVPVAAGSVTFNDQEVTRLAVYARSRLGIGRSFQSLELFDDVSVEENIRVASDARDRLAYLSSFVRVGDRPLSAQARTAIGDFGLETDLSRDAGDLPYARRHLVAIARAVATEPSVLLLDEPAAGLDDTARSELKVLVNQLGHEAGMAVVLVEHDMEFVMGLCDRIVVLVNGAKIADGSPAEVQGNPAVQSAYLGTDDAPAPTVPHPELAGTGGGPEAAVGS